MMEQEPTITDIRWMVYSLATTFIESATTVKVRRNKTRDRNRQEEMQGTRRTGGIK
jgi:hypothetical protein